MKIKEKWGAGLALLIMLSACGPTNQPAQGPEGEGGDDVEQDAPGAIEDGDSDAERRAPEEDAESEADRKRRRQVSSDSPVADIMFVHFRDAEDMRKALIFGQPEDTGGPAQSLIKLFDVEKVPAGWAAPIKRMQAAAERAKDSSDVAGVAAAMADIGTSCGSCHQQHGGPKADFGPAPPQDKTLASTMKRHAWATERLWEGLYVPSGKSWQAGAKLLAASSFPDEVLKKGGVYAKTAAKEFLAAAEKAPKQQGQTQRAALYAEIVKTCATCHLAVNE